MSEISDYTSAVNARFDELEPAFDAMAATVTGIADDVAFLKETITKMENNPGPISPEDQALLTQSLARVTALDSKVKAQKDALEQLDAATERPDAPPPEGGGDDTPPGVRAGATRPGTAQPGKIPPNNPATTG